VSHVAEGFLGEQLQRVPDVSAIKQQGERLYNRARRGEIVDAPTRQVVVRELEVLQVQGAEIQLRVRSGKGFYVRSLARDLARALGSVGHLSSLRRTHSGAFSLADAVASDAPPEVLEAALLPPAAALRDRCCCTLTDAGVVEIGYGRPVALHHLRDGSLPPEGQEPIGLLDERGTLRALGRAEADRIVVIRGLVVA
jgi:tRNA pseudouridine55 synthase